MIIALLLSAIVSFISQIASFLPIVGVANIPIVGPFTAYYMGLGVSYMNTAITIVPFTAIVWTAFTHIILPFEVALLIAKFFFGARLPSNG